MIETVFTERNGERERHEQAILKFPALKDVSMDTQDGELLITVTGDRRKLQAFLRRLVKELEKEMV